MVEIGSKIYRQKDRMLGSLGNIKWSSRVLMRTSIFITVQFVMQYVLPSYDIHPASGGHALYGGTKSPVGKLTKPLLVSDMHTEGGRCQTMKRRPNNLTTLFLWPS